jgi:hypothetical protein
MNNERETNPSPSFIPRAGQWLLWISVRSILGLVILTRLLTGRQRLNSKKTLLVIESGQRGWELIEYEGIYESACDYLGIDSVAKNVVIERRRYLKTMRTLVKKVRPTHYFYDPRTGSQNPLNGLFEALFAAILFQWFGVTPIAWLTDLPVKAWRHQCIVLTARSGVIVTLMSPRQIGRFIPHDRLTGPSLMALSTVRMTQLKSVRTDHREKIPSAMFSGSLYEPRTTILNEIRDRLRAQGLDLEICGRSLGGVRVSNSEYWARLSSFNIIVTTADQISGRGIDQINLPHLIFRYSEALAAGSLLIAQEVQGARRYFLPGVHYISYRTPEEAAERIAYYLPNESARETIASAGAKRMGELVSSHTFWVAIDSALGKESLT